MARRVVAVLLVASFLAIAPSHGVRAEEATSPYGGTYTAGELAALDRALHAANMTREDLTFRKDMTKGHACFTSVRDMLRDPLWIAPWADRKAYRTRTWMGGRGVASLVFDALETAYEIEAERRYEPSLVGPRWSWDDASLPDSPEALLEVVRAELAPSDNPDDAVRCIDLFGEHELDFDLLRFALPPSMAWHDVFDSPFKPERSAELESALEQKSDAWLHETAAQLSLGSLIGAWQSRFGVDPRVFLSLPASAFPMDEPLVVESVHGRIALGTPGDDVYTGDYTVLIDPGGNDRYEGCRIGAAYGTDHRRVAFFADLGGDDVYDCGDVNVTLGAAVLGVAAFFDLGQGNDRYIGGHCSLGAAMGGIATFYDDGGTDTYQGKTFTQGAAGFGIGIFYDDSVQPAPEVTSDEGTKDPVDTALFDNDRLSAWSNAQAFARCRGVALCVNKRGNEIYEAGGVYLHAPLFADRYQSFSQGFAIGERGIDYAGGIAMLIDHEGNDRYLGDIYNQGVGYWYSAGLLWDGGGNDTYEMTQYGQGSGIHLAVGGLVDVSGHDTYVMHSGLGQGGSHDYAASILHDRAGNDRYLGNTSCNGAALTNSVGIQIDRSGDDLYAGRSSGSINFARPARGFSSIAVLLDLGGKDDYLGIMRDETAWRHTDIGVGLDTSPEPVEPGAGAVTPAADQPSGRAEIPAVCAYEGELTQEVFDELWAISVRWEVGDNRAIVPKARARLIAFGPAVLPLMDAKVEESASGLELRAYVDILKALGEQDGDAVSAFLRTNLASDVERRQRIGLYLVGELKATALETAVVGILAGDDEELQRRAAGVLALIGSHAGDDVLKGWLASRQDERKIQTALGTLLGLESDVYADVRPLLDHPLLSVRTRLSALLVGHAAAYLDAVRADIGASDLSDRARRTVLDVLVRTGPTPDAGDVWILQVLLEHDDWGVRADTVRLLRRWGADETADPELLAPALKRLDALLETETDPYVRFCAREDGAR